MNGEAGRSDVLHLVRLFWSRDTRVENLPDWGKQKRKETIERLSQQHGLSAWTLQRLSEIDPDEAWIPRDELRAFERHRRKRQMLGYRDADKLVRVLRENEISVGWLKGPNLSELLYSDMAFRTARDFDLLIEPQDLPRAIHLISTKLAQLDPNLEQAAEQGLLRLMKWRKDIGFTLTPNCFVELHTRPTFSHLISGQIECDYLDSFEIKLAKADLFFYLVCHGEMASWVRLKWALDVAELSTKLDESDWQQVRQKAKTTKCTTRFANGLSWVDHVFGTQALQSFNSDRVIEIGFSKRMAKLDKPDPRMNPFDLILFVDDASDRWRSFCAYFLNPELSVLKEQSHFARAFAYSKEVITSLATRAIRLIFKRAPKDEGNE